MVVIYTRLKKKIHVICHGFQTQHIEIMNNFHKKTTAPDGITAPHQEWKKYSFFKILDLHTVVSKFILFLSWYSVIWGRLRTEYVKQKLHFRWWKWTFVHACHQHHDHWNTVQNADFCTHIYHEHWNTQYSVWLLYTHIMNTETHSTMCWRMYCWRMYWRGDPCAYGLVPETYLLLQ